MPEHPLKKPNFSVCFEPANSLIRINWQGEVNGTELLEGYKAALVVIKQNPVHRILIDNSRRQLKMNDSPEPMFETLFNEALRVIGNTLFLALVVTPEEFYLSSEAGRFVNYEKMVNDHVIVERFKSRQEAEAWLASVK
jgi:hypothetical protein